MKRHIFAVVMAVLFVVLPAKDVIRASASLSYTVEDLGTTIDGFVPIVTGMNASGQVSGYVNVGSPRAVRFTNGIGWEYLPGLGSDSLAMAINASGDVAGYHTVAGLPRAFRYTQATGVVDTIDLPPGGNMAWGFGINASGEVTGYGDAPSGIRGWRAAPGHPTVVLPTLGGDAVACGINDAGQITGFSMTVDGHQHAYRLEVDNSVTDIVPFDGPTGTGSACAIDAAGHVGGSATSGSTHADRAFRFLSGAPVNLDTFASRSSSVAAIANAVSVGWFVATADGAENAFVHSDAHGSANLNDLIPAGSGWRLNQALAVNTAGQIAGQGRLNNVNRAFRLTPVAAPTDTTAPVISSVSATPSTVWPPNGELVAVSVSVEQDDATAVCSLTSLTASSTTGDGSGITGPLSAQVRAVGGVTYTLTVTCSDAAGNSSSASTSVVVPRDTTAPVITNLYATPDAIWPPNGKMVPVTVSVSATDDVDSAPQCYLASVSGGSPGDAVKTGRFTADVRSEKNGDGSVRVYSLNVKCFDSAGNKSVGVATVVVGKDSGALKAFLRAQVVKAMQELKKLQRSRGSSR